MGNDSICRLWYNCEFSHIYERDFWFSVRRALFGIDKEHSIPAKLEVVRKKIIHTCGYRYISIAKTLVFLSKSDKIVEQWSKIAVEEENTFQQL